MRQRGHLIPGIFANWLFEPLAFAWLLGAWLLGATTVANADEKPKVIWYGTLQGGLAEAKRSNRPILLLSAAPHCQSVSGVW